MIKIVDLLLGGSPCQGFSFAGKRLNFSDPRSKLFFDYVKALKELKPKYYLLENVKMTKESQDIISSYLGVEPIKINSADFSAQDRKRLYWTNIPFEKNWEKSQEKVRDVLQDNVDAKYFIDPKDTPVFIDNDLRKRKIAHIGSNSQGNRIYKIDDKAVTLCGHAGGRGAKTGLYALPCGEYSFNGDKPYILIRNNEKYFIRKLTPIECERLQTLSDNYTKIDNISNNQRYQVLGNGWTVNVIAYILSHIPQEHLKSVVSLFDGISCGQVALNRAGKTYEKYYASEIDKNALKITEKNFENTIQLGDVTKINWKKLKKAI